MVDTTLFDRVLFMIPHHVCFPYLERGWSGWAILIQGQTRIAAWMDQKENRTSLDHNCICHLLHIFMLKHLNVLYNVQNQDNIDLSAWINFLKRLAGSLKVHSVFKCVCFQATMSLYVISLAGKWC